MSEIKFRAWYKPKKEMVESKRLESINFEVKTIGAYLVKDGKGFNKLRMSDFEIMQYTGLKDKNGVEIYEGDILDQNRDKCVIKRCVGGFDCKMIGGASKGSTFIFSFLHSPSCEVIGNIYENADLLKV
jgi:hypothetical protein